MTELEEKFVAQETGVSGVELGTLVKILRKERECWIYNTKQLQNGYNKIDAQNKLMLTFIRETVNDTCYPNEPMAPQSPTKRAEKAKEFLKEHGL